MKKRQSTRTDFVIKTLMFLDFSIILYYYIIYEETRIFAVREKKDPRIPGLSEYHRGLLTFNRYAMSTARRAFQLNVSLCYPDSYEYRHLNHR